MKVKDLMTPGVWSCAPDAPVAEAARLMWEHDCGFMPVVDEGARPIGVVTDRDICMGMMMRGTAEAQVPVRELMGKEVFTCSEDAEVAAVHAVMRDRQVRRVPVVDAEGQLTGVVTLNDMVLKAANRKARDEVFKTLQTVSRHYESAEA